MHARMHVGTYVTAMAYPQNSVVPWCTLPTAQRFEASCITARIPHNFQRKPPFLAWLYCRVAATSVIRGMVAMEISWGIEQSLLKPGWVMIVLFLQRDFADQDWARSQFMSGIPTVSTNMHCASLWRICEGTKMDVQ